MGLAMPGNNYHGDTSPYSARKAFRFFARAVLRNGYHPIPIVPNAKRPALADWTFFCRNQPYPGLITKWLKSGEYTRRGLGIACGRSVIGRACRKLWRRPHDGLGRLPF